MIIFRLIVMFCIDMFYFEKVDIWQTIESDVIIFWSWKSTKCPKKIEKNRTGAIFHTVQTVLYRNETDRQNFLHSNSEHPILLKNSIPYSQILRVKRTCPLGCHSVRIFWFSWFCQDFKIQSVYFCWKSW